MITGENAVLPKISRLNFDLETILVFRMNDICTECGFQIFVRDLRIQMAIKYGEVG